MSLGYPENVIWYIKATLRDGSSSEGSAVAIRLQEIKRQADGSKEADPTTARTYLLTCAHVLRDKSSDKQPDYGPVIPDGDISAWMPGTGRAEDQRKSVRVNTRLRPIERRELVPEKRKNAFEDWVVLEILDDQTAETAAAVETSNWDTIAEPSGQFRILGYPGGAQGHAKGVVVPTSMEPFPYRDLHEGLLRLNGTETAAGMSGGGVFRKVTVCGLRVPGLPQKFAGIHRAREFDTLQLHAVSAQTVFDYINSDAVPYELARKKPRHIPLKPIFASIFVFSLLVLLVIALFCLWWFSPKIPYATGLDKVVRGLQLNEHIPPDGDQAEFREGKVIEDVRWFPAKSGSPDHVAFTVPENQELVLKTCQFEGAVEGEILLVRSDSYRVLKAFSQKEATVQFAEGKGLLFPSSSLVVLRSQTRSGVLKYKLSGYLRPANEFTSTNLTVKTQLLKRQSEQSPFFTRTPLQQCQVVAVPDQFQARSVDANPTDSAGQSKIRLVHELQLKKLAVYFRIDAVSDPYKAFGPLIPLDYGEVITDGGKWRGGDPLVVVNGQSVALTVVPHAELAEKRVTKAVSGGLSAPEPMVYNPAAFVTPSIADLAQKTKLQASLVQNTLNLWTKELQAERPAVLIDASLATKKFPAIPDWDRIRGITPGISDSVCYVTVKGKPGNTWSTGFVIGKDLVLAPCFSEATQYEGIGLAPAVSDKNATTLPVRGVAYRSVRLGVALLDVPGVAAPWLKIAEANPFGERSSRIIVVGYTGKDTRLPEAVQAIHSVGGENRKRVMPGDLLAVDAPTPLREFATLTHDAWTMGGAAGAPVIDVDTGIVVGIHLVGHWEGNRKLGGAVPIWTLLGDAEFKRHLSVHASQIVKPQSRVEYVSTAGRSGYSPGFLPGAAAPLPTVRGVHNASRVLAYEHFSIVMDQSRGFALYTASNVDRQMLKRIPPRGRDTWVYDPRIAMSAQRGSEFYTQNDWDRGHLVRPLAVAWGAEEEATRAHRDAFTFTNVTPQYKDFNRKTWAALEEYVLKVLHPKARRLSVFSGPVFYVSDPVYRSGRIPQKYWMVVYAENREEPTRPFVDCWLVPHIDVSADGIMIPRPEEREVAKMYGCSLYEVEAVTGLVFHKSEGRGEVIGDNK